MAKSIVSTQAITIITYNSNSVETAILETLETIDFHNKYITFTDLKGIGVSLATDRIISIHTELSISTSKGE